MDNPGWSDSERQAPRSSAGRGGGKLARRARNRALRGAVRRALEPLEPRVLLSGALLYVNDNWHITLDTGTPGLSEGDTVDNSGTGDDGSLHDLTFGTNAFNTLAGALAVATSGDRIVLVSGSYAESATITQGVALQGWAYFAAASSLPAGNPDPLHLNQSALNATLVTQISGAQWSVNDPTAADSVSFRGMAFSGMGATASIWSPATNQASLAVLGNAFTDSSTSGTAVRIDAGSVALPVDIENNVFTGVPSDVAANGVTGLIAGNSASGATMAITVSGGANLTIANNTIGGLQAGAVLPGVGILTDSTAAGVGVTGNHMVVGANCDGIVVSNTGTESVAVNGNVVDDGGWLANAGIIVTNEGASFGFSSGPTMATVNGNQLTNLEYGIALDGLGSDAAGATITDNVLNVVKNGIFMQGVALTTIQGNQLTSGSTGISVVADGSALIAGNSVNDFATGILFNSGAPGTITGTRFDTGSPNPTDIKIIAGGLLVFAGGDHFGTASIFVENLSPTNFALSGEDFGTTDASVINSKIIYQNANATYGTVTWVLAGAAVGEHVFYKGSAFDTGGGSGHDAAIAPDKSALLPGGTATFANYTSYDRGLNGLMVDLSGTVSGLTPLDFLFKTGNDNSPGGWTSVTAVPTITVRPGYGIGGTTRVEIAFADGAIKDTWLQVTVLAGARADLLDPVVFYFGNAVGEAGNSPSDARVDAMDELLARWGATATTGLGNPLDFNRDGVVDGTDALIARGNMTWFGNELHLITAPEPAFTAMTSENFAAQRTWNTGNPGGLGSVLTGSVSRTLVGQGTWGLEVNGAFRSDYATGMSETTPLTDPYVYAIVSFQHWPFSGEAVASISYTSNPHSGPGDDQWLAELLVDQNGVATLHSAGGYGSVTRQLQLNTPYRVIMRNTFQGTSTYLYTFQAWIDPILGSLGTPLTAPSSFCSPGHVQFRNTGSGALQYSLSHVYIGGLHSTDPTPTDPSVSVGGAVITMPTTPITAYVWDDGLVAGITGTGAANTATGALSWTDFLLVGSAMSEPQYCFQDASGNPIDAANMPVDQLQALVAADAVYPNGLNTFLIATNIVNTYTSSVGTVVGVVKGLTGTETVHYDTPITAPIAHDGGNVYSVPASLATGVLWEDGKVMGHPYGWTSGGVNGACVLNGTAYTSVYAALDANPGTFWCDGGNPATFYFSPFSGTPSAHMYTESQNYPAMFAGEVANLTLTGTTQVWNTGASVNGNALLWFNNKGWSIARDLELDHGGSFHTLEEIPIHSGARNTNYNINIGPGMPVEWVKSADGWVNSYQLPIAMVDYSSVSNFQASFTNINFLTGSATIGTVNDGIANASSGAMIAHLSGTNMTPIARLDFTNCDLRGGSISYPWASGINPVTTLNATNLRSANLTNVCATVSGTTATLAFDLVWYAAGARVSVDGGAFSATSSTPITVTGLDTSVNHVFEIDAVDTRGNILGQEKYDYTVNSALNTGVLALNP